MPRYCRTFSVRSCVARAPVSIMSVEGIALAYEYDPERHLATVHLSGLSADWSTQFTR